MQARFETLAPRFLSRDAWRLDQRGSCRARKSQQVMLDPSLVKEIWNKAVGGITLTCWSCKINDVSDFLVGLDVYTYIGQVFRNNCSITFASMCHASQDLDTLHLNFCKWEERQVYSPKWCDEKFMSHCMMLHGEGSTPWWKGSTRKEQKGCQMKRFLGRNRLSKFCLHFLAI